MPLPLPAEATPLEAASQALAATYGGLTLRNGVPIGYVQVDIVGPSAAVSFNTFDTFRGAEAAHTFARWLAALHHHPIGNAGIECDLSCSDAGKIQYQHPNDDDPQPAAQPQRTPTESGPPCRHAPPKPAEKSPHA